MQFLLNASYKNCRQSLLRTTVILPVNDYFTKLSLLVSSSHWRGRGKEREFTSLPGNRQFKIVIKRIKE